MFTEKWLDSIAEKYFHKLKMLVWKSKTIDPGKFSKPESRLFTETVRSFERALPSRFARYQSRIENLSRVAQDRKITITELSMI